MKKRQTRIYIVTTLGSGTIGAFSNMIKAKQAAIEAAGEDCFMAYLVPADGRKAIEYRPVTYDRFAARMKRQAYVDLVKADGSETLATIERLTVQ
jgi:hypothetical protein